MTAPAETHALATYSAEIGADPLLIQGAGGNTSIKLGDEMWIKASGTQLKDALKEDIFVCVESRGIAQAVRAGSEDADQPQAFLKHGTLRPSIETCLHAIMPQKVVIHVHCVSTIAQAIRKDAEDIFCQKFAGFDWAFVSYVKPGAGLAAGVISASETPRSVYVLGNHGLLIGADDVESARSLLTEVTDAARLTPTLSPLEPTGLDHIETNHGVFERAAARNPITSVAQSTGHSTQVADSALFPDQVLFCGPDIVVIDDESNIVAALNAGKERYGKRPPVFLLRGRAAYIHTEASATEKEMIQCVGDVMVRVPSGAELSYLSKADCAALLNWDAEKYRHQMNS